MSASGPDFDQLRADSRDAWEQAAGGWGRRAEHIREWAMPVSVAMIDALELQPGQTVLELAAGPGDTGFMAAETVAPGGRLICSDGATAMLDVARARAAESGLGNVEFKQLELEWIDLATASVDAALCRWGIMLTVDPEAAAREIRRVVRTGGRAALAVWDRPEANPWATIPSRALIELGHLAPPDPGGPGMFRLAGDGVLAELLRDAGFVEVTVTAVPIARRYAHVEQYLEETIDMSQIVSGALARLGPDERTTAEGAITAAAAQFRAADGTVTLPGSSLVASAAA